MQTPARRSPSDTFGSLTFTGEALQKRLPAEVYRKLVQTVRHGRPLEHDIADTVALAMKEWAGEKGATHYCHWFQPLTGATAEKHDAFLRPDGRGRAFSRFSGSQLVLGEPDASSFPSGGIRDTYEARGYTTWDPTSPAFVLETGAGATLCIPSAFVSYHGEALDKKTPLLRSIQAVSEQAGRILRFFGNGDREERVVTTLGAEQEYFLIDRRFYDARPDLQICGRTLIGSPPPKGHQLDDHYFGAIPERVLAFMTEVEDQLCRLGVPVMTRHNEVAPRQYELAPMFEETNIAADHQMLVMHILERTAERHGFVCLLHEKPFTGVNGSGKHNNWSLATTSGINLLDPQEDATSNLQFLVFLTAVLRAVDLHGDLLRAVVAGAGNDHRLGANEAPPAIISVYLGEMLSGVLDQVVTGEAREVRQHELLELGARTLPDIPRHGSDRNRTSPFAFTGDKFEFRAVGSPATVAWPNTVLNTIVAESLDAIAGELERRAGAHPDAAWIQSVVMEVLREEIAAHRRVVFDGDSYSADWHREAERRGLPHLKSSADALPVLKAPETLALFETYRVLSRRELEARADVQLAKYAAVERIEARTLLGMVRRQVLPAAMRHQTELARLVGAMDAAGQKDAAAREDLARLTAAALELRGAAGEVEAALAATGGDPISDARQIRDRLVPARDRARAAADLLETLIPADLWPLPTYAEMLFKS